MNPYYNSSITQFKKSPYNNNRIKEGGLLKLVAFKRFIPDPPDDGKYEKMCFLKIKQ